MGKSAPKTLKPHEIEAFNRQQNRMNNPNVTNTFGSTTTTFGPDDQANIVQQLSPEMQGIIDSQMGFVSQGPAQLGNFSNPFMESMMQGNSNGIARRGGYAPGNASQMGGYSGFSPQMPSEQQALADALGANPGAPMDLPGVGPVNGQVPIQPTAQNAPQERQPNELASQIGQALQGMSSGVDPYSQMGMNLSSLLQKKPYDPNQDNRSV